MLQFVDSPFFLVTTDRNNGQGTSSDRAHLDKSDLFFPGRDQDRIDPSQST